MTGRSIAAMALATALAAPASAPGINLPPSREVRLQHGAFVILAEKHDVPLIACYALLRGGGVRDPAGNERVAALTGELLRQGAGGGCAQDVAALVGVLGAPLGTAAAHDASHSFG